jgi:hypothetical protein
MYLFIIYHFVKMINKYNDKKKIIMETWIATRFCHKHKIALIKMRSKVHCSSWPSKLMCPNKSCHWVSQWCHWGSQYKMCCGSLVQAGLGAALCSKFWVCVSHHSHIGQGAHVHCSWHFSKCSVYDIILCSNCENNVAELERRETSSSNPIMAKVAFQGTWQAHAFFLLHSNDTRVSQAFLGAQPARGSCRARLTG